jgi:predicted N-acetyltransferase YhbS
MQIREELSSDVDAVQEIHRAAFASQADQVVSLVHDLRRSLRSELGISLMFKC